MDRRQSLALPRWTESAKREIIESEQWQSTSSLLFSAVRQKLDETGVRSFADLSDAEKTHVIDRATAEIRKRSTFAALNRRISSTLDKHVREHVATETEEEDRQTSVKLLRDAVADSSAALLSQWPDLIGNIRGSCFNRDLSPKLRYQVWKIRLTSQRHADEYWRKRRQRRRDREEKTASKRDFEIGLKTEGMLQSFGEETMGSLLVKNHTWINAMKSVLSYYDVGRRENRDESELSEAEYLLAVPLVSCVLTANCTEHFLPVLIEMYMTLLERRPLSSMPMSQSKSAANELGHKVESLLKVNDRELLEGLQSSLANPNASRDDVPFYKRLRNLLHPPARRLFVGYLSIDVVSYVWDQCIIAMGVDLLPWFCAGLLLLNRSGLLQCQTLSAVEHWLVNHSCKLKARQFQTLMDGCFHKEVQEKIGQKFSKSFEPVTDPWADTHLWDEWFKKNAKRNLIEERRRADEEERKRLMEAKQKRELDRLAEQERARKADEERDLEQQKLKRELETERQKRTDAEGELEKQSQEMQMLKERLAALETRSSQRQSPLSRASSSQHRASVNGSLAEERHTHSETEDGNTDDAAELNTSHEPGQDGASNTTENQ